MRHPNAISSPNTNVHPQFASKGKLERNLNITKTILNLGGQRMAEYQKQSVSEDASDPLHRDVRLIYQRTREEMSNAGRSRAMIRPAAPGQVTWKNAYWQVQKDRQYRQTAIGPYTQGSLPMQSILNRISVFSLIGKTG